MKKLKLLPIVCLFGLLFCGSNTPLSPWKFVSPMLHGRYCFDAVYASNGKIYIMGGVVFKIVPGFKRGGSMNSWWEKQYHDGWYSNLAYDPGNDKWEYMTSVPIGLMLDQILCYNQEKDIWSYFNYESGEGDSARYFISVGDYDAKGNRKREYFTLAEIKKNWPKIYHTGLDRQGNGLAIAGTKNGTILWTGGYDFAGEIENVALVYNVYSDSWPECKRTPPDKNPRQAPKTVFEYDQRELFYTDIPPMQEPRRDHRAVALSGGRIFVMGGWHKEKIGVNPENNTYDKEIEVCSDTMECLDPQTKRWEYKNKLSCKRMLFAAVTGKDDKIYLFGSRAGYSLDPKVPVLNTTEVYDPKTDSWSFRKSMPTPRFDHTAALAADGRIYIMGGVETFDDISASVLIYDPERDSWEKGPDMILPRAALAAVATPDGKIYAIGGTDVDAYNDKARLRQLKRNLPHEDLSDYTGKVQEMVEVLDIYKWRKSLDRENKKSN